MRINTTHCLMRFELAALILLFQAPCIVIAQPFAIQVVDKETSRGIPLVELKTTTGQIAITDSNGFVAIDDPVLLGRNVFFHVSSHGYEMPQDGFGYRGIRLDVRAGGKQIIELPRINIAERLYRITGAGIYRDSVKLKMDVPIRQPLLNAQVCGQDSVQAVARGSRIHWFWGDTNRLSYPLGNFNTSGATSRIPEAGGLDPAKGIDLRYFKDDLGFSRPMFKSENGVLIWVQGVFVVNDAKGDDRIVTHYSRRKSLEVQLSHGLAVLNEQTNLFEPVVEFSEDEVLFPRGQSFGVHLGKQEFIYFASPYPTIRVAAKWESIVEPAQYESFTPLKPGCHIVAANNLERDKLGSLIWGWKRDTAPVEARQMRIWERDKTIRKSDNQWRTVDSESGKPILLHAGSVHWNEFRHRWIMIAHQAGGERSVLGEVWFAESKRPEGPFARAVRIVTHDRYSFYNVAQHDFFDQNEGQLIYFEGTYTTMFSRTKNPTPGYNYNQIMYRLDLDDERLNGAK